ncbi:MAG: hypothetical protein ABS70_00175 [Nitrospira sp. SCN 59-13]|nr:MAG: hypothetical protein ABS70_00175 [Nitrospira sp. SCN 59-13]
MAATHKNSAAVQPVQANQASLQEEIQTLAYELYCQYGYEHGHDLEHWAEAERRVLERVEERSTR